MNDNNNETDIRSLESQDLSDSHHNSDQSPEAKNLSILLEGNSRMASITGIKVGRKASEKQKRGLQND